MIAEDQTMVRQALVALLELEPDIEVVAEAAGGDEALAMARKYQPDVAVLDIEMPGPGGIEVARKLTASAFPGKIVIVTTFGRPGYLRAAMAAGATGFLLKDSPAAELAEAIRRVAAGERVVDTALAAAALAEGESPLSQRETDVLAAAASPRASPWSPTGCICPPGPCATTCRPRSRSWAPATAPTRRGSHRRRAGCNRGPGPAPATGLARA